MNAANPQQRNVIFILADQLGRHALRSYGNQDGHTPHLDAMARDGVRFHNACSTYPICVAYRFTLMTGQYCHTRNVPGIDYRMSPAERTLADEFNENGYETMYVGKWHLNGSSGRGIEPNRSILRRAIPRQHQGRWQTWIGFENGLDYFHPVFFKNDDPVPIEPERYETDACFDFGLDCLRKRDSSRPFCLVISFTPPHVPFSPPEELAEKWKDRPVHLPPNFFTETVPKDPDCTVGAWNLPMDLKEKFPEFIRKYHAMIENADQNVGRLMAYLKDTGLDQNTVVVFTADHGDLLGTHRMGEKQYPQEESVGVPLIARGPGITRGKVVADPTCTEDLFPTLLGLAALRPRQNVPGTDLSPLMRGEFSDIGRAGVMLEYVAEVRQGYPFYAKQWRAFRGERYKYIVFGPPEGASPWCFYDLKNDPYEMHNLVDSPEHRQIIGEYHRLLRQRIIESQDHFALLEAWDCEPVNVPAN